jgi:hypothetical protein
LTMTCLAILKMPAAANIKEARCLRGFRRDW